MKHIHAQWIALVTDKVAKNMDDLKCCWQMAGLVSRNYEYD